MPARRRAASEEADRPWSARKAAGEFFTPLPVVRYLVRQTLQPLLAVADPDRPVRILEPACGEGVFLAESYRYLLDWHLVQYLQSGPEKWSAGLLPRLERSGTDGWQLSFAERERILLASLFGVDVNPQSIARAQRALAAIAVPGEPQRAESLAAELARHVRCGDALIEPDFQPQAGAGLESRPIAWRTEFPEIGSGSGAGFDAVLGNPPYVNIRLLTRSRGPEVKRYLQQQYRCARGAYDLYILFLERAFELLRAGGTCGFVVPNKIATLQYAKPCRKLLLQETTLLQIADLAQLAVFPDAGVYPYLLVWQKQPPPAGHRIVSLQVGRLEELAEPLATRLVPQADLAAESGLQIHGTLDVEARVPTRPLGEMADLHSGSAGFDAARIAAALREAADPLSGPAFDFIVSGNVDRYAIRLGRVRFMKQVFARPVLPADSEVLTVQKRSLFASPKLVLAGMTQRLEAAWDRTGLALGVQVYAALPRGVDLRHLLGILNSKLLSHLFRLRFQAKRLAGGYLAINKSQLAQLPIRVCSAEDPEACELERRLIELVERLQASVDEDGAASLAPPRPWSAQAAAWDAELDRMVYQLYRLTDEEIRSVEAGWDDGQQTSSKASGTA